MVLMILRNCGLWIIVFLGFLFSNAETQFEKFYDQLAKPMDKWTLFFEKLKGNKEIVNVTCILDKYGTGYVGTHNTTYDGLPCEKWSLNSLMYTRYKLKGKNISENYCGNPDGDREGPWCFAFIQGQFMTKRCDIPLCQSKIAHPLDQIHVGAQLQLKRECPFGFTTKEIEGPTKTYFYCEVNKEFLNKLPIGQYSLKMTNSFDITFCPKGFEIEIGYTSITEMYCTRTDSSNNSIEFPNYVTPKADELIFVAHKLGTNSTCPQMTGKAYVIIRKSEIPRIVRSNYSSTIQVTTCHYFSQSPTNKFFGSVDRNLAILVQQKNCPTNWTVRSIRMEWPFNLDQFKDNTTSMVDACIPSKDVENYPDGDYCLLSLSDNEGSSRQCPEEFVDVKITFRGRLDIKFCCMQSRRLGNANDRVYDFYNWSTIFIINSAGQCEKSEKKYIIAKHYTFKTHLSNISTCTNCDLFEVFSTMVNSSENHFKVCRYEKAKSVFAYATLNSMCPPKMNYAYIQYSIVVSTSRESPKLLASFCIIPDQVKEMSFPEGHYCIYKLGSECPIGFQTATTKLPFNLVKYSDSGGYVTNYDMDIYCCKFGLKNISFENATLPYVTQDFQFGLPYANRSFSCVHGLATHTATEDHHMCHYYPTRDKSLRDPIVVASWHCDYRREEYKSSYRLIYSPKISIHYCKFYVNDRPPPGNYCAPFSKTCPTKYFDYITYYPLIEQVICCRKPIQNDTLEKESEYTAVRWTNELKSFSLLPYKEVCPIFERYNYGKKTDKSYFSYIVAEMSDAHRRNLTGIGIYQTHYWLGSYTVVLETCNYKLDTYNLSVSWPHFQYAFPKPISGCPSSFKSGEFSHSMETSNPSFAHSDTIHLDGDYMVGGTTIKWGFCVRKNENVTEKIDWPYGRYCVMKVDSCRYDFYDGSVKFVEITALNKSLIHREGVLPKIETDGPFITYHFCCDPGRGDIVHEPIYLPTQSGPFYLMKYGTYCQMIYGMRFTEEFICIDSEDSSKYLNYTFQVPYKSEGATPVTGSFSKGCNFQINLCYYELDTPVAAPSTPKPGPLVDWPIGSYIFLKPYKSLCPSGFDEGTIVLQTFLKFHPKFMHSLMFGSWDENNAIYSYCKRNSSMVDKLRPAEDWPPGNYCLIFEGKCPPGMLRSLNHGLDKLTPRKYVSAQKAERSSLCCQKKKQSNPPTLPYFPGEQYSFIMKPTQGFHACPPHQNTRAALVDMRTEYLCIYERLDENIEFPDGGYLFPAPPAPMNACASGFKLVEHRHLPLKGDDKRLNTKILRFCQKEGSEPSNATFPRGNYCILTTSDRCPSSRFTIENNLIIPFYHFENELHKFSRYLACCQKDEKIISNIAVSKVPFALYSSSPCSYVDGFPAVWEIEEDTVLVQPSGLEKPPFDQAQQKLRICKYHQIRAWTVESKCQCHPNANCGPFLKDNNCQCRTGYFGDGKAVCAKITDETDKCANLCDKRYSVCSKSSSDRYSCICKEGYDGNGIKCNPSCKTRNCKAFSRCVTNELESHCICNPSTIEVGNGRCHGDLVNTMYQLSGFDYLSRLNLSCFGKEAYDHLVIPKQNRILFLFFPTDKDVLFTCDLTQNYYGFALKQQFYSDIALRIVIGTASGLSILVAKSEYNEWRVGDKFKALKTDLFTNAVVLYLNGTETSDIFSPLAQPYSRDSETKLITGFVVGGVLLFFLMIILLFIMTCKRQTIGKTRTDSNTHFKAADDKFEMRS